MSAVATRLTHAVEKHRIGAFDEAEFLYRQIIRHDPRHAEALNLLGALCAQTGRPDQAVHYLRKAIRVRPDHAAAHYNLANVLRERGEPGDAVRHYEHAVRIAPDHASAWFNLGLTELDLARPGRAEEAFRAAIEADDEHAKARHELALLLLDAGRPAEAAEYWRRAVNTDPAHREYQLHWARALYLAGRFDEAAGRFREITRQEPDWPDAWCGLGAALRMLNRPAQAIEVLHRALRLQPSLIEAQLNLAWAHLDQGRLDRAFAACGRAIEIDPTNALAHRLAARALRRAHEPEGAEQFLLEARRLEPQSATVVADLGDLLRQCGRFDEAKTAYREALALQGESIDALTGLALAHWQSGNHDKALRLAHATLRKFPGNDVAAFTAVELDLWADRPAEAAALAKETALRPGITPNQRCMLLFKLGEAHDRLGQYEAAWDAFREANRLKGLRFDRNAFAGTVEAIMGVFPGGHPPAAPLTGRTLPHPIFILGMPRSGTTLVEQILASHPEVSGGGEVDLIRRAIRSLSSQIGIAPTFPDCVARFGPDEFESLARLADQGLQKLAGQRPRVTEKTLTNSLHLGLIELLFPSARIIMCQRDPLDTCLSCYFHDFTGDHPYAWDLGDLGFYYGEHDRLLEHWRRTIRLPMITVRYEELVADQVGVTRRLLDFCDLSWNDSCLAFHENRRLVSTASAEQVRRPIYRSSVGRHRNYEKNLGPLKAALAGRGPEPACPVPSGDPIRNPGP